MGQGRRQSMYENNAGLDDPILLEVLQQIGLLQLKLHIINISREKARSGLWQENKKEEDEVCEVS